MPHKAFYAIVHLVCLYGRVVGIHRRYFSLGNSAFGFIKMDLCYQASTAKHPKMDKGEWKIICEQRYFANEP